MNARTQAKRVKLLTGLEKALFRVVKKKRDIVDIPEDINDKFEPVRDAWVKLYNMLLDEKEKLAELLDGDEIVFDVRNALGDHFVRTPQRFIIDRVGVPRKVLLRHNRWQFFDHDRNLANAPLETQKMEVQVAS